MTTTTDTGRVRAVSGTSVFGLTLLLCQSLIGAVVPEEASADAIATPADPPAIRWEPYSYETRTGDPVTDGELGRLEVPQTHGVPGGPSIDLAFVRFRSTAPNPGPPIIWLAGGPSDFGTDDIEGPYLELVRAFQAVGDVIALDQRGTGLTRPRLDCPENRRHLSLERAFDPQEALAAYIDASRECAAHFEAQGIDLTAYNTVESAHDVDLLRRALDAPKVHLYGGSYGSHLAFAVLRYHGDAVERVVVGGIEGPDQTWKLPSKIDQFYEEVFSLARQDEVAEHVPDLELMVRTALERLEKAPVTVELPTEEGETAETITLGAFELRLGLRAVIGDVSNIAQLPQIFSDVYEERYVSVAQFLRRMRTVSVGSAMYYSMDCASGASDERLARLESEPVNTVGPALNFPFPDICAAWPHTDLGADFRRPLVTDRPTLFLSGALDGQTPPSNAREVAATFSSPTFVVIEGASHRSTELSTPELPALLAGFLAGVAVADTTIVVPFEFGIPESP